MVLPLVMFVAAMVSTADPAGSPPSVPSRGLVVVLSPEAEEEVTRNATARIRGELAAAPFQVVPRPLDPGIDLMREVETAGQDLSPVAAFAIVREGDPGSRDVAVWVSNRITQTTTVHRVQIRSGDADGAAAHLAIEAVELVRASMAGLWPRAPAAVPAAEARVEVAPPEGRGAEGRARVQLGIGIGVFAETGDAPALLAPIVALAYGRPERLALRLKLVGLGPGTTVSGAGGTGARLQRATGALGVIRLWRPNRTFRPLLAAGLGAQYLRAEGTGAPPTRERTLSAWSALLTVGAGCVFMLGPRLAVTLEADLLLTWPTVVVEAAQADLARFERPSILLAGGLLATF